jgi:alginate O-acetyltransferase complex protein AlgI
LDTLSGNMLVFTFLLQPITLYCDFSGYTDIALGIGKTFGFTLTNNFNRPFFSSSITMFWKRWHISLSSWCNEFIFRRLSFKIRSWGIWGSVTSVFVTFIIIGLWHGPGWNFLILGILQGIAINYEFFSKKYRIKIFSNLPNRFVLWIGIILTYIFVCTTLLLFYAPNISDVAYFISNMFMNIDFTNLNLEYLSLFDKVIVCISLIILFMIELQQQRGRDIINDIGLWPRWIRILCYYSILILIVYFSSPSKEFVYIQF